MQRYGAHVHSKGAHSRAQRFEHTLRGIHPIHRKKPVSARTAPLRANARCHAVLTHVHRQRRARDTRPPCGAGGVRTSTNHPRLVNTKRFFAACKRALVRSKEVFALRKTSFGKRKDFFGICEPPMYKSVHRCTGLYTDVQVCSINFIYYVD